MPSARPAAPFAVHSPADLRARPELALLGEAEFAALEALARRHPGCLVAAEPCGPRALTVRVHTRTGRLLCVRHVFPPCSRLDGLAGLGGGRADAPNPLHVH